MEIDSHLQAFVLNLQAQLWPMSRIVSFTFLCLALTYGAWAEQDGPGDPQRITKAEYIKTYAPHAVREMHRSGVPASITLAQGMLESGDGNSDLARKANNHFGIKCHGMWEGRKYHMDDDAKNECFRAYNSVLDSYRDHSDFLKTRDRYAFLFELKRDDYKGWAHGLKKAGYATNPKYPELLIKMIEDHDLAKFDHMKDVPTDAESPREVKAPKENKAPKTHYRGADEAVVSTYSRQMYLRNNIRYVRVEKGDNLERLERLLDIRKWQLRKYNDLAESDKLEEGEILYLQPKRAKNTTKDFHIVAKGENLRWISQEYGVKIKNLRKYNRLDEGQEPTHGSKIWLRRPKKAQ